MLDRILVRTWIEGNASLAAPQQWYWLSQKYFVSTCVKYAGPEHSAKTTTHWATCADERNLNGEMLCLPRIHLARLFTACSFRMPGSRRSIGARWQHDEQQIMIYELQATTIVGANTTGTGWT